VTGTGVGILNVTDGVGCIIMVVGFWVSGMVFVVGFECAGVAVDGIGICVVVEGNVVVLTSVCEIFVAGPGISVNMII